MQKNPKNEVFRGFEISNPIPWSPSRLLPRETEHFCISEELARWLHNSISYANWLRQFEAKPPLKPENSISQEDNRAGLSVEPANKDSGLLQAGEFCPVDHSSAGTVRGEAN